MVATKNPWAGRLGIEIVGKMKGCCAKAILKWRPQTIGQKTACTYCGSFMKTIRAGEVLTHLFTGWMGEEKAASRCEEPEILIGGLYFSTDKFPTEAAVKSWMSDREINPESVIEIDDHAFYVPLERLIPESTRAVWVAPGVVGEIGVSKQVATGGGQASMSSPGITVASMDSGGLSYPAQGPTMAVAGMDGSVLHGLTEEQDGHRHEYSLAPFEDTGGPMVRGFTTFDRGHAHMIEASLDHHGFDTRTAPDQTPVGGHAHSHRVVFGPMGIVTAKEAGPSGDPVEKGKNQRGVRDETGPFHGSSGAKEGLTGRGQAAGEACPLGGQGGETPEQEENLLPPEAKKGKVRKVSGSDLSLLNKAAESLRLFHENVTGEGKGMADFQVQLSQAIERARGTGTFSGEVELDDEDVQWVKEASQYIEQISANIINNLEKGGTPEGAKKGWETRKRGGAPAGAEGEPKHGKNLSAGDKNIVERLVGDFHVGMSDSEVEQAMRERFADNKLPERIMNQVVSVALKAHAANRKQYKQVMSGR